MTPAQNGPDFILPIATYPDATSVEGLRTALDFASRAGGRVTALLHEIDIPPIYNPVAEAMLHVAAVSADVEADSRRRGQQLTEELRRHASALDLAFASGSLKSRIEAMPEAVAMAARTHDQALLVLEAGRSELAEAVLFDSGGATVFIPAHPTDIHFDTVAIAWDGSRGAARAVRDAMPYLRLAGSVVIATFEDEKPHTAQGLVELRKYLEGHGVETRHVAGSVGATTIGDAIQDRALQERAGLVVMGGYGHSRFQEIVLGGATRTVLQRLRMPVLMSR